jgi:hypothetical protein
MDEEYAPYSSSILANLYEKGTLKGTEAVSTVKCQ